MSNEHDVDALRQAAAEGIHRTMIRKQQRMLREVEAPKRKRVRRRRRRKAQTQARRQNR